MYCEEYFIDKVKVETMPVWHVLVFVQKPYIIIRQKKRNFK